MDWALAIKEYRTQNALTQAAFAEIVRVDPTTISRWERGRDKPDLSVQRQLRDLLTRNRDNIEHSLRTLIDTSTDLVMLIGEDLKLVRTSGPHQRLMRYSPSDFYGADFRRVLSSLSLELYEQLGGLPRVMKDHYQVQMRTEHKPFERMNNDAVVRTACVTTIVRRSPHRALLLGTATIIPPSAPFVPQIVAVPLDAMAA